MKKLISLLLVLMLALSASMALAATEPNSKTIEETTSYETENLKITIDRWCFAFNRTECRSWAGSLTTMSATKKRHSVLLKA